ncbi:MAG: type II toxin-antitoxin system death-on-curing family toxin [Acidobacteriota bacterium]
MATKSFLYLTFAEAVFLHLDRMKAVGETRYGVDSRALIESALARPQQAAIYENADLTRQAATLYFGLIKNHPWLGGNKRTATILVDAFLILNDYEIIAPLEETIELVLGVESDKFSVNEIEEWLRERTFPVSK